MIADKDQKVIELLYELNPQRAVKAHLDLLRRRVEETQAEFLAELQKVREEKRWGEQGDMGYTPMKGTDYVDGYTPVKGVDYFDGLDGTNGKDGKDGKNGRNGVDGKDGVNGTNGKDGKNGQKAEVDQDEIITALIERLKKKKELDISHIRNSGQFTYKGTKYNIYELMHGGSNGSAASSITYSIDLSSQANGVNKVFTVPSNTNFISLSGTDSPFIYRPLIDYTGSGTTTLTLDTGVNAPSLGSTLILTYIA